jgi:hypothetical protein
MEIRVRLGDATLYMERMRRLDVYLYRCVLYSGSSCRAVLALDFDTLALICSAIEAVLEHAEPTPASHALSRGDSTSF